VRGAFSPGTATEDDEVSAVGTDTGGAEFVAAPDCDAANDGTTRGECYCGSSGSAAASTLAGAVGTESAWLLAPGDNDPYLTGRFCSAVVPITAEDPGVGIFCGCNTLNSKTTGVNLI
jgi:hypothetical protein